MLRIQAYFPIFWIWIGRKWGGCVVAYTSNELLRLAKPGHAPGFAFALADASAVGLLQDGIEHLHDELLLCSR